MHSILLFPIFLLCIIIGLNGIQAKLLEILKNTLNAEITVALDEIEASQDEPLTNLEESWKKNGNTIWHKLQTAAKDVDEKRYDNLGSTSEIVAILNSVVNDIGSVIEAVNETFYNLNIQKRMEKLDFTAFSKRSEGTLERHLKPVKNIVSAVSDDLEAVMTGVAEGVEEDFKESSSPYFQSFEELMDKIESDSLSDNNNTTLKDIVVNLTSLLTETIEKFGEKFGKKLKDGEEPIDNKLDETLVNIGARLTPNITLVPDSVKPNSTATTIFGSVTFIGAFIVVVLISLLWYRRRFTLLTKEEVENFRRGNNISDLDGEETFDCLEFPANLEISRSRLILLKVIGQGNFGVVYNAKLTDVDGVGCTSVAVKKINRPDCSKESFKSILSELKVLCYVGSHSHVLEFVGAHIEDIGKGLVYIATVLCENGSLEDFLQKAHARLQDGSTQTDLINVTPNLYELSRYAHEIALEMEFLSTKKIIHGDLSTRNVLLDTNYVCKIGDFGLSRKLNKYQILYQKKKEGASALPWRWLSFESLKRLEFSTKSDVWSYGITLWEIYTLGEVPYPNHSFTNEFITELENGMRMSAPPLSTDKIYHEMTRCWDINPELRPSFKELSEFFASTRNMEYTPIAL